MKEFTTKELTAAIANTRFIMEENKQYLTKLDSVIGDGDLGLTMAKGFSAADETATASQEKEIGKLFKMVGFSISKAAPSTMGTLMATAFIGAGKSLANQQSIGVKELADCFMAMADAVSQRGKAKEGEKTLLDVLYPVGRAMQGFQGDDISLCMEEAYEAAKAASEEAKNMMNQHGKAAVFREKTIGLFDPGAEAARLFVLGFAKAAGACREI